MKTLRPILAAAVATAATVSMLATVTALAPAANADVNSRAGVVAERPRDVAVHAADGEVRTIAQVGSSVVFGGSFTKVGPATRGAAGVVDIAGKTFGASFPDVNGTVNVSAPDGSGGWYVGGDFATVGGQNRANLAHVDASGALTSFDPGVNGPVYELLVAADGDLLVGGNFTQAAGTAAAGVARIAAGGTLEWGSSVTGAVRAMALSADESTLYIGGDFSKISGITVRRLAALDPATGARKTSWAAGMPNLTVNDLDVRSNGDVIVAGNFTTIGGVSRGRLASLDGTTGALGALNVSVNGAIADVEIDQATGIAYLGGAFFTVGSSSRKNLAGVDLAGSGTVTSTSIALTGVNPNTTATSVSTLELDGSGNLYIGGNFQVSPEKDNPAVIAKLALATNTVSTVVPYYETPRSLARTPKTGTSGALSLVVAGGSLFVGGDFSDYGTAARSGLAAYDLTSGALRNDFNPSPDGMVMVVRASANAQAVFVGGEFDNIAGAAHSAIAKLDIANGQNVAGFNASANSYVKDMAVRTDGTTVYVGGNFDVFNGVSTSRLTSISASTGDIKSNFTMPLTEPTNDSSEGGLRALVLTPDESTLMVTGNFRKIAGLERPLIAQIDVAAPQATVTDWHTDVYDQPCTRSGKVGWMRDLDVSPNGQTLYVVSSGHFYYPACDSMNAFSMANTPENKQPIWTKRVGDTMESVTADQNAVYLSGHFRYLDTETDTGLRFQIAAVEPDTGEAINWVPDAGGFRGVLDLELEPAGLFAASDGDAFGGVNHGRNAFWPNPAPGIEVRKAPSRPFIVAPSGQVSYKVRVQNTFTDRSVTVTSLTDARMGNLNGSGNCSLPQTVAAGEMYSCTTAEETVSGTSPGQVTAVLTAIGDANGQTVTDTDKSALDVLSALSEYRIRPVVGPGVVSYPGATVRFNIAFMNNDPVNSGTVTLLTSTQFGDLATDCGLPITLAPSATKYCHFDRFVTGSVGSKPTFDFTSKATYPFGIKTSLGSQTVTINPPVGGTKVLAVVANPTTPSTADLKVTDYVQDDYSVTYIDDDTVTPADVASDYSFVILYPSVVEARLGTRLRDLDRPVMVLHSRMLDEMGMATTGGQTASLNSFEMVTSLHPMSRALAGTQSVATTAFTAAVATPASAATVIAKAPGGAPTEFVYQKDAAMAVGNAPACRIFFSNIKPTSLNSTAWSLFVRAEAYAAMDCGKNMLWTAAGNGAYTLQPEGNQSVATPINTPWGIAIDNQDRVYYADNALHIVRRINADGTVSNVAGTGVAGSTGDGGPATAAKLNAPVRLTFDAAGNLYIADSGNNKIRKVTPAGIISTVAGTGVGGFSGDGGQATAAKLKVPYDMTIAPDGTMYIADRSNYRIRKVTPAGIISTVAGNGLAGYTGDNVQATTTRLNSPYSVDLTADGALLIADYDNERIRRVDTNGVITTVAGTGIATADGDGGLAIDGGLHKPQYVMSMPNGDYYIGEANNNRVRFVHDGVIDTLAGSGQFGYLGDGTFPLFSTWQRPSAMAFDSHGNLWVVDRQNRRLRVINAS